ncbi:MAG: hypothetical protein KatS3mg076_1655 [Candidatus Binatia bacterium]|nr:MAG: hypothetical protein KatS3mg076_1655 [Candidatus Binatia bacterium]
MKRTRWLLVTALAGGVLLAWTQGLRKRHSTSVRRAIEKEGIKLESKLIKALQKCKDFYRKQLLTNQAKGTPGDKMTGAGGVGEKCAKQLVKTWVSPTPTENPPWQRRLTGLLKLVPTPTGTATPGKEKCTDADLIALGHLPVDTFGDKFARLILIMKQKGAYYQQIWLVRDVMNIFQRLAGGHPTINDQEEADCDAFAGGLCAQLTKPPCAAHACALGSGSKVCVDTTNPALDLSLTLQGFSILQFCDVPSVLPDDFAVIGSPSKGLLPVPLTGVGTACVLAVGAEGYVTRSGSANPKVDYTICQDHDINTGVGATGNDCLDVFTPSCHLPAQSAGSHDGALRSPERRSLHRAQHRRRPGQETRSS